ncbi:MAG TPA: serine/threonine-protein kinase [Kofleriaceae bacterium]|nr:serine/threonine-protein kinase [Kofleriaceae bacterium]
MTAFGSYVIREELGRGGMAVVFRAESRRPETYGQMVALKRLRPANEFDVDFATIRSFIEEARLATRFRHPNIARTYALGKADGSYFIEMEYVPGPTLYKVAKQTEAAGAVPIAIVGQILMQILDALEHVHTLRDNDGRPLELVHRDVSLSNIIVSNDGTVKLIDFGIVKGHSAQAPTEAGILKGKVAYIAPEYLTGAIDRRADLFAVGVIAHELLSSRRLFHVQNDLETLVRVRTLRVPPPSRLRADVPPALDAIVMRALARDPAARWQSAPEMRAALAELFGPIEHRQVAEYVDWAFQHATKPVMSQLIRVIDALEQEPPPPPTVVAAARPVTAASAVPYMVLSMLSALIAILLAGMYAIA